MRYFYPNTATDSLKGLLLFIFIFFSCLALRAQEGTAFRTKQLSWEGDTVRLDTLSLVPGSVQLRDEQHNLIDTSLYEIHYFKGIIILKSNGSELLGRDIHAYYRVYPFDLSKEFKHKDIKLLEPDQQSITNPFIYSVEEKREDFFELEGLNKSGSISRGVTVGNNQDLAVNSNLDLQLSGKLTEDVRILAAISDGNLPIQPEGNTQQLQEFDRVYIQLYNDNYKLLAGDFRMKNEDRNHFLKYNKSLQGGSGEAILRSDPDKPGYKRNETYYAKVSAAVSKGKFAINKIQGQEGNQGPYLLTGDENESFIVVISGTERVYIDGKLMERGQNFDYVIDYNSAEITFTPNQIITKDKRITVEFQYSDRYFARSLYHIQSGYENDKWRLEMNYYNEGDNKNQPLDQNFSDAEKKVIASIGDSLDQAIVPNIQLDTNPDLSREILYQLVYQTRPFGPDSFFVYSTDPDSAIWRVGFAKTEEGKGDYILASTNANGKVFLFVPRDSLTGLQQGNYLPLTIISTPKRRQMVTLGGEVKLSKTSTVSFEGAFTSNDINTYSSIDDGNNDAAGIFIQQDNSIPISDNLEPVYLDAGLQYELVTENFRDIERFRDVEFYRDWNQPQPSIRVPEGLKSNQHLASGYVGVHRNGIGRFKYTASTFQEEGSYTGVNNKVNGALGWKKNFVRLNGSYLESSGNQASEFLRYNAEIARQVWKIKAGIEFEEENSKLRSVNQDSILPGSFRWTWYELFITNADSTENNFRLAYRNRYDYLPDSTQQIFRRITFAEDYSFEMDLLSHPLHQIITKATYRKLQVVDSALYTDPPEDNILGKIDYQGQFFKRMVMWQSYYEVGSGLEIKKEVVFEGPLDPGQGNYVWKDLNDDGVQQKDEFFLAPTSFEGIYNRVLLPTNEFTRAYTTIFNQVIFIKPEAILYNKKGFLKFVSHFSDKLTYRVDKKADNKSVYNPLRLDFEKDSLLNLSTSVLNTFYINRLSSVFGIELNYRENYSRNFLVSGFESRFTNGQSIRTRWNITKQFTLNTEVEDERDRSYSENFTSRRFDIISRSAKPEFYFQPGIAFRIGMTFQYREQKNQYKDPATGISTGGQVAIDRNTGLEMRYNVAEKGSFQLNLNFIVISFFGIQDPTISNEMLEGLQPGKNGTWNLLYQRNLGKNVQLSLNYSGRQSEGSRMVHLGGAQVRAFF